jgi:predicted porin
MNKKLMAVAVAGLFAAPAVALAQSSVTISGMFKGGYENMKYGNSAKANNSQNGVVDDSSRIIFNVTEDLGGGLAAIGQLDMRFTPDVGTVAASGNTFFGLRSKDWGTISLGRRDLHYFNRESNMTDKASLRSDSISLLAYAGGGSTAIANATRTQNVVHYLSPNWSGFTFIVAYSSNPSAQDADINSGVSKGSAWNFNPNYQASNWQVGWSHWESKPDAAANTFALGKQKSDRVYGSYVFPMGIKLGLAWDSSKIDGQNVPVGATQVQSKRDVWSIPISYTWGNHSVHFHYDQAGDDKRMADTVAGNQKAKMYAISYAYDLSKRTSAALAYAQIKNNGAATYNFFTATSLGLGGPGVAAGEDPKMWGVTLRHAF